MFSVPDHYYRRPQRAHNSTKSTTALHVQLVTENCTDISGGSRISRWGGRQFTGVNRADYDAHLSSFLPYFI